MEKEIYQLVKNMLNAYLKKGLKYVTELIEENVRSTHYTYKELSKKLEEIDERIEKYMNPEEWKNTPPKERINMISKLVNLLNERYQTAREADIAMLKYKILRELEEYLSEKPPTRRSFYELLGELSADVMFHELKSRVKRRKEMEEYLRKMGRVVRLMAILLPLIIIGMFAYHFTGYAIQLQPLQLSIFLGIVLSLIIFSSIFWIIKK